jgi:hypothetical protein
MNNNISWLPPGVQEDAEKLLDNLQRLDMIEVKKDSTLLI